MQRLEFSAGVRHIYMSLGFKSLMLLDPATLYVAVLFPQLNTEWAQVEVIELIDDGSGLGFEITGDQNTGSVVQTVLPGGAAERVSTAD